MKKQRHKAEKAYRNERFLASPDARSLRILSEFIEPLSRFRRQHVSDTIVFYGSARIIPPDKAKGNYKALQKKYLNKKQLSAADEDKLQAARTLLEMSKYYQEAVELSRMLTQWSKKFYHSDHFVVCSGGGPGIMEAANRGARLAGGRSVGLNISLPFEQSANPYIPDELNFEFHYFFMRKFWFAYLGKAFVMFPGGYGTFDELMEILTLLQTEKIRKKVTVVLYGSDYWRRVVNFPLMEELHLISRKDLNLFSYADSPKEAFDILVDHLRRNYPTARMRP
ncbi:MAG TPA: LOG family protein [Bacteroidota bacterium]|nr:LOG family protein [Bacteroidota bacterium]